MAITYILKCSDGSYYIGCTNNINQRITDHKRSKNRFTKSKLPVSLVYTEIFNTKSLARKRETQIKRWKSRKAIERLIQYGYSSGSIV